MEGEARWFPFALRQEPGRPAGSRMRSSLTWPCRAELATGRPSTARGRLTFLGSSSQQGRVLEDVGFLAGVAQGSDSLAVGLAYVAVSVS